MLKLKQLTIRARRGWLFHEHTARNPSSVFLPPTRFEVVGEIYRYRKDMGGIPVSWVFHFYRTSCVLLFVAARGDGVWG